MSSPERKLRRAPSIPRSLRSSLLDPVRMKIRKPTLAFGFDRNVMRYSYYKDSTIYEKRYNTRSLDKLKDRAPLQSWIERWNYMTGRDEKYVELNLRNYMAIKWDGLEDSLKALSKAFVTFLQDDFDLFTKPEDTPLIEVFEAYSALKTANYTLNAQMSFYHNIAIFHVLWRRTLSSGSVEELKSILQYLEVRGEKILKIPHSISHLLPVDKETAAVLKKCKDSEKFKTGHWGDFVEFFLDPWKLYTYERGNFQDRYFKLIHEALGFALMDNNLRLARQVCNFEIGDDFIDGLSINTGKLELSKVELPKDMYERAAAFTRSNGYLFLRLIFLEAEDVVLDWLEDPDRRRVIAQKFHIGDCEALIWENDSRKMEVVKFYDDEKKMFIPGKKVRETKHWGFKGGYKSVTALQVAMEVGNARIVERLLELGANPFQDMSTALRGYYSLRYSSNGGPRQNAASRNACFGMLKKTVRKRIENQSAPTFTLQEWLNKFQLLEATLNGNIRTMREYVSDGQTRSSMKVKSPPKERRRQDRSYKSFRESRGKSLSLSENVVSRALGSTFTKGSAQSFTRAASLRLRSLKPQRPAYRSSRICTSPPIIKSTVRTLDMIMLPAFETMIASNAETLRAIGRLLHLSGVFLNRHRYTQIGILALDALETNRAGEESALKYLLFDCELIELLLDKDNIRSVSKYTRPISSLINMRSLKKVDKDVNEAKNVFMGLRIQGRKRLKSYEDKMLVAGVTTKSRLSELGQVRKEQDNLDFETDGRFNERGMLLGIAKNGQMGLLKLYIDTVKQGEPIHNGLLESVIRCAIAHDQRSVVEYFLASNLQLLSRTARKALFDTGSHDDIFQLVMELTHPTTAGDAEAILVDLFTCRAVPEVPIAGKVIRSLMPGGPESELPAFMTESVCRRALHEAFSPASRLNAHTTNKVMLEVIFPNFEDIFSLSLLEECVDKVLADYEEIQSRKGITVLDGEAFDLFRTIYEGCTCTLTEDLEDELAYKCSRIHQHRQPLKQDVYAPRYDVRI